MMCCLNPNVFRYGNGIWTSKVRETYNLVDGVSRHTVQVSWLTFILQNNVI